MILAAILLSQKYDDSNQLVVDKMEDETGGVVIKEFVGLKPKKKWIYSWWVIEASIKKQGVWIKMVNAKMF